MQVRSKLPNIAVTFFTVMARLANEHGAINLSQGFPDFAPDGELFDLVAMHMRGGNNQYAPMQGVMALRERISEKVSEIYNAKHSPVDEITVTSGGTEALYAASGNN
jgi:methionine transaminase